MKATEQYFPVVLFIMLYKVVLTFESVDEILWCDHWNESYWAVLSCGTVYYAAKVVLTFESLDEILWYDHSNKSYWVVLSCGTFYYAVQGGSNFYVCRGNPMVWPLPMKPLSKGIEVSFFFDATYLPQLIKFHIWIRVFRSSTSLFRDLKDTSCTLIWTKNKVMFVLCQEL